MFNLRTIRYEVEFECLYKKISRCRWLCYPQYLYRTWFLFKRNERDYPWLTRFLDGVWNISSARTILTSVGWLVAWRWVSKVQSAPDTLSLSVSQSVDGGVWQRERGREFLAHKLVIQSVVLAITQKQFFRFPKHSKHTRLSLIGREDQMTRQYLTVKWWSKGTPTTTTINKMR